MRLKNVGLYVFLSIILSCTGAFGQTAATQERLLDALDGLWQQYGRQPTTEEIENGSDYTGSQYLQSWDSWEEVRLALAEHLYQKGVLASLQNDRQAALAFFARCLSINPQHANAGASYNSMNRIDLNEAAQERSQYTNNKAGREAMDAYRLFTMAYSRGNNQEAEQHYLRARRLKQEYTTEEIQRLQALLESAITAFEAEDYGRAEKQLQELNAVTASHAGYEEVIQPVTDDISRYMAEVQGSQDARRVDNILNITRSSKITIWLTGAYYATSSDLGLKINTTVPLRFLNSFGLSKGSFVGSDIGLTYRVTDTISAGVDWSWMVRSPNIKYQKGVFQADAAIDGGSVHGFSAFVQPGKFISKQIRLYAQVGISLFRINLPPAQLNLINGTTVAASESPTGFFFGGGANLWNTTIGNVGWGLRTDFKYHIVQTKAQPPANLSQKLELNGIRVGFGVIFALGGTP